MHEQPGHDSGQPPAGLSWGELVASLVAAHGTLTAVAWKLIEHGDDVASIERALRRLRTRGQLDGGMWGQRVLRVFGVPASVESRLRWMGLYHSPFTDLPLPLCQDQLRLWDRPPVSESRARVWLHLGQASCALRQRDHAAARRYVDLAAGTHDDTARVEAELVLAYIASHTGGDAAAHLDRVTFTDAVAPPDRACFEARLVDQRAYQLNRRDEHAAARALYDALPDEDVHPFASYRRDAGRAWGQFRAGETAQAIALATRAIEHAGDGGYTRLRAMGLLMLARFGGGAELVTRAHAIATRLEDIELLARVARHRGDV
ncbi:MAG TPA: hypothetical protein VK427_27980 [Kofleriaceae bacterium]|nr:hypothetical protein [Kofleriaceae bacterium]